MHILHAVSIVNTIQTRNLIDVAFIMSLARVVSELTLNNCHEKEGSEEKIWAPIQLAIFLMMTCVCGSGCEGCVHGQKYIASQLTQEGCPLSTVHLSTVHVLICC